MSTSNEQVKELLNKLNQLLEKQENVSNEILLLKEQVHSLLSSPENKLIQNPPPTETILPVKEKISEPISPLTTKVESKTKEHRENNLEKFIGENLISKIGIIILVIGVAIGAKYAIDKKLISPLGRIIAGYLTGGLLLFVAYRLKKNFLNFSAVLLSGAIAIMYFITFFAFSFYELIPRLPAFAIMLLFTIYAVYAALQFNNQVIANIGLVGAYAIPILLSDGSGKAVILFSYMVIINTGILVIAVKKYWKPLFYVAFIATWLIFLAWYGDSFRHNEHLGIGLAFSFLFYAIFYFTFLVNKVIQQKKFVWDDVLLLLANSFIFYGLGYSMLAGHDTGKNFLGIYTLANGLIHLAICLFIYKNKLADKNLFYMVLGLVSVFITIAIPVQLDGNWVTLLWATEAALLFWVGRVKKAYIYEKIAYPLLFLSFISIIQDWDTFYFIGFDNQGNPLTPLLNKGFMTSLLVIASLSFVNYLNINELYESPLKNKKGWNNLLSIALASMLFIVGYYAFRIEIANSWKQLYLSSMVTINDGIGYEDTLYNQDIKLFKTVWLINYTLLYLAALNLLNIYKTKSRLFGYILLAINAYTLIIFLSQGLYVLSELRDNYLTNEMGKYFTHSSFNIVIRYTMIGFAALLLFTSLRMLKVLSVAKGVRVSAELFLTLTILWVCSSELINWMNIGGNNESYKLGLSILWGIYSMALIALGIIRKKLHLRIAAISVFGVTLLKLFFYDISHLDNMAKTIVFVTLGILLLVISFLYNKYKHLIFEEEERKEQPSS